MGSQDKSAFRNMGYHSSGSINSVVFSLTSVGTPRKTP
jgi:hypothetical protein